MRRFGNGVLSWLFGLATSVLLVSIWGRSVVTDPAVIIEVGNDLVVAEIVVDQIEGAVSGAVAEALEMPSRTVDQLVEGVMEQSGTSGALVGLVEDLVRASMTQPGQEAVVDVASRLQPVAEVVAAKATELGYPVAVEAVSDAISALDPIVVKPAGALPVVGSSSPIARSLGVATVLAGSVMLGTGLGLVGLSGWSRVMVRSLLGRVALSGFTFSVFLQLGSWVVDPAGGRAPIRSALASALWAKAWVPVVVGLVPAIGWVYSRRRLTRGEVSPGPTAASTPVPELHR